MKKIYLLILVCCCLFIACKKSSNPTPQAPSKPLQIVISNITSTLTIYSFSVVNASSDTLINIHSQTENKIYTVNVNPGEAFKLNYFLELEGPVPPVLPVVSFIYDGVTMASVTNDAGIISGVKYVTIPH